MSVVSDPQAEKKVRYNYSATTQTPECFLLYVMLCIELRKKAAWIEATMLAVTASKLDVMAASMA
jgi:hypothetical protein